MGFLKELNDNTFAGNYYYIVYIVCIILCLCFMKKRRIKFIFPMVIISIIILNPWFYDWWTELAGYAYWRIAWVVPIIPLCAATPAVISEQIHDDRVKIKIGIVLVGLLACAGKLMYKMPGGKFEVIADNPEKLPQYVIDASDTLLKIDGHPRVVASTDISVYMRQYTGEIDTLFGRDVYGHILYASDKAQKVNNEINSPNGDMTYVAGIMLDDGYDYLVLRGETDDRKRELSDAGFEIIYGTEDYSIYKVTGTPSVVKDRNELGQVLCETIVDKDGNPMEGSGGYAYTYYEYDRDGNVSRLFRTNLNGVGVLDKNWSAGYERIYDRYGQVLSEKNLGVDGKISLNNKGYAEARWEYNKKLWGIESYFDVDGTPTDRTDIGYATKKVKRDDEDRVIEEAYYDKDGKLHCVDDGYALCQRKYDGNGSVIEEAYYDENNERILRKQGYAKVRRWYTEDRHLVSESFYNEDDEPIILEAGYASYTRRYDTRGNVISEIYYDENGDKVLLDKGYAEKRWTYYEDNSMESEAYYDTEGKLVALGDGFAKYVRVYDDNGNVIDESYYDESDNKVMRSQGYAEVKREYDEEKHVLREAYYDVYNNPVKSLAGYVAYTRSYDELGNVISEIFYDETGKKTIRDSGYAERRMTYYDDGRVESERYYDIDGSLRESMYGYAGYTRVYDSKGNVIKEAYYDESDNLVSCLNGYASVERKYDEFNRIIEETYRDNDNKPCLQVKRYAKIEYIYDEAGNMIQEAYYDKNDNPVSCLRGYAKVEREYDQDRHLIKEKYYNPDGISYVTDEGYSGVLMSYDDDDNLISKKYIDENDDVVTTKEGYSEARWEKDKVNNVWDVKFYDDTGTEIAIEDVNLYTEMYDGWSEWMSPYINVQNSCFSVGNVNLGEKNEGDEYVCEIEIEFKNVTATEGKDFRFWTQGAADGKWTIGNVWNTSLIYLEEAPDDGVYTYTVIQPVNEAMQYASTFNIGFRCDNWASGSFRVRNINIKKCLK